MCDPHDEEGGTASHVTAGYTCGLWTLFHMLTFSAPRAGISPIQTMAIIRSYVDNFFGCAQCRQHFLQMYDECWGGRCDITEDPSDENYRLLALWLWRAHNTVNGRVAIESTELAAGDLPKVAETQAWALWPGVEDCESCRRPNGDGVVGEA